ncbi:MAG: hypothetical protein P1U38_09710 [Aeromicrobium sp.]|uniref:hypothetical protein n=1 Tax=Aeromicrobium sp. TaxID=1871063 RepID=UPI002615B397|nr:hypothetical protein [Aeromicrobium sp.]MDF1705037.1 hypothetical protein [Aeromicrobium sp.]
MTDHDRLIGRTTPATAVKCDETVGGATFPIACVTKATGDVCLEILGPNPTALYFTPTEAIALALHLAITVDELHVDSYLSDRDVFGLNTLRGVVERTIQYQGPDARRREENGQQ